jgi:hypothetical protein
MLRPGRLDKILYVPLPGSAERPAILRTVTTRGSNGKTMPLADDVDLQAIGTDKRCTGFSGADLAALVREAGILALEEIIKYEDAHGIKQPGINHKGQGESSSGADTGVKVKVEGGSSSGVSDGGLSMVRQRHFEGALNRVTPSVSLKDHQQYLEMASSISGKRAHMGNKVEGGSSEGLGAGEEEELKELYQELDGGKGGGGNSNGQHVPAKEPRAKTNKAKAKTKSKSKRAEHEHGHPAKKQRADAGE